MTRGIRIIRVHRLATALALALLLPLGVSNALAQPVEPVLALAKKECVLLESIEPRLYLAARMIMDIASGKSPMRP